MPHDPSNPVEVIKRAALDAVNAAKPVHILFGTVMTDDPLKITTDQKMELELDDLVLARQVTEYEIEMTVDHQTELETEHTHDIQDTYSGGGSSSPTTHRHAYAGRKTFLVHNGLKIGEVVILLRWQGSTKYLVLDRVGVKP